MNGVFCYRFGTPEPFTPATLMKDKLDQKEADLPKVDTPPLLEKDVLFKTTARGCVLEFPFEDAEQFYGLGLQMKSLNQNWKKKTLRVNSDPVSDAGDSHAPVPMFVSNKGYAVYIDTARYASFYFGTHTKYDTRTRQDSRVADNTADLYAARELKAQKYVTVEIPVAKGVDVYLFAGPSMREAVMRYNMFSGGGYLPPLWGLGIWYRTYVEANADSVKTQSASFRKQHIPCDVYGLEPHWQSHAYSCTYQFNRENFSDPQELIDDLREKGYRINLWEHAYVHPDAEFHSEMKPYAGDYRVWEGLVPDFTLPEARRIFADYHRKNLIDKGISGFKLDECDNSDFIWSPWAHPECAEFPSGLDGEQMHCLMGNFYMKTISEAFAGTNQRQYHAVRSAGAFASDYPFVLYSDLYDHKDFIRSLVNSGFCGLTWTPEVRQCDSVEDLYRRVQSAIFSPMALINAWMIPHAPWLQVDELKNKAGVFMEEKEEATAYIKELFELRMRFVPYLYAAYRKYEQTGFPVFRALVMDYPDDVNTFQCDLEYMMGDSVLVAPLVAGETSREVYLPEGKWHDFNTGAVYEGGKSYHIEADIKTIPIYIKDGSLIPFAEPYEYAAADSEITICPKRYGEGTLCCSLFEDDGETCDYQNGAYNDITLVWEEGKATPEIIRSGNAKEKYRFVF